MTGSSVTFIQKPKETSTKETSSSRKNQSRTSVFQRLGSPTASTAQGTGTLAEDQPFCAGAGRGARHRPYPEQCKMTNKTSSASSARQRWRGLGEGSPGGLCPTVEESAGHLPGHQHCRGRGWALLSIRDLSSFRTRNNRQHLQQAMDALLLKGALERVTKVTSLGYYSRLFLVPKATLIYMFRCIKLSRSICDLLQFSWLNHKLREVRPHSKSGLPVHRDAVQHSRGHSGALPKMRL